MIATHLSDAELQRVSATDTIREKSGVSQILGQLSENSMTNHPRQPRAISPSPPQRIILRMEHLHTIVFRGLEVRPLTDGVFAIYCFYSCC